MLSGSPSSVVCGLTCRSRFQLSHLLCSKWLTTRYSDHSPVYAAFKLGMRLPLSIINIPGELPRARSSREGGLLLFSKVSAKINLTRSGIASPSSPGSGQRGTIEDELLRSPPGTTSDGDWNPYIKFVAPFIAQDRKYKTSILKRVGTFFGNCDLLLHQTDSPYWEEVDGVPLVVVEKEYLMANHIVLVFMSDTPKGHKNIPLGQAVVPLRSAFEDQPTPFSALISHKGKECGVVAVSGVVGCNFGSRWLGTYTLYGIPVGGAWTTATKGTVGRVVKYVI